MGCAHHFAALACGIKLQSKVMGCAHPTVLSAKLAGFRKAIGRQAAGLRAGA